MFENPSLPSQESITDEPLVSVITVVLDCPLALEETIKSVAGQTYGAIEHIIIDGESSDETLDVIGKHDAHIARSISEPDRGIYDAINKGIGLSTGKFICILHAGDTLENDYVNRAVRLAIDDSTIPYSAYRHDGQEIPANEIDDGIYLHNFGISISTCLVPRTVYSKIGLYDKEPRIVSDMIWMRRARDAGIAFVKLDGFPVNFSSNREIPAETKEQQQFVLDEWISSYRTFFPFLPETICEAIYLYRFDERCVAAILSYVSKIPSTPEIHPRFALFLRALKSMLKYLWQKRKIDSCESDEQDLWGETRLNLADLLNLPLESANVNAGSLSVGELAKKAKLLREELGAKTVVLHYLEASPPFTEVSVCNFIHRLSKEDSRAHVILRNRRDENTEKISGNIFAFNFEELPRHFANRALSEFLQQLDPKLFIFYFCSAGWNFLKHADSRYHNVPTIYIANDTDIISLHTNSEYSCFIKEIASNLPGTRFISNSNYLRNAMTNFGIPSDKIELIPSSDNLERATERWNDFSNGKQIAGIRELMDRLLAPVIRITLLSTSVEKGAGYSALRVHEGLLASGAQSRLIARQRPEGKQQTANVDYFDEFPSYGKDNIQPSGSFQRPNKTIFSVDTDGLPDDVLLRIIDESDIISIHWYARFLSNTNIANLTRCGKPVVFTIRDMHPLTGGCHYFHGCDNWEYSCYPCPQFLPEDVHLPHATFKLKKQDWDMSNVTVIVLSEHTRRIVEASPLFGSCRIEKISNSIDTSIFYPRDAAEARALFNLPPDNKIIAYIPSSDSTVKGKSEAAAALANLTKMIPPEKITLLCAGYSRADVHPQFNTVGLGYINDRDVLAKFYSAADVTLVPSLEETFSNTAAESIACGTPVVGFATGAVADLAQGYRGMTVAPGDVSGLARATATVLSRQPDREACHTHIATHYSMKGIGRRYAQLFEELVEQSLKNRTTSPGVNFLVAKDVFRSSETAYADYLSSRLRWATFAGDRSGISLITGRNVLDIPLTSDTKQKPDEPDEQKFKRVTKKNKPPTLLRSLGRIARTAGRAVRAKAGFPKS